MSHLLRVLVAVSVLAVPGVALAQCTKDTECKGDRVCERGACVSPSERAPAPPPQPEYTAPPPPPVVSAPPPAARPPPARRAPPAEGPWDASARKNVIAYNFLSTLSGFYVASTLQNQDPGLSILQFGFIYERVVFPNFTLTGSLTPNFWSDAAGGLFYCGITAGARYYFFGNAPDGFWAGGEMGTLALNLGLGLIFEGGYQWALDSGLTIGVTAGLSLVGAQAPQTGVIAGFGLGGHVGWNF
ncbi:MAG TPA: hypothetical protein VIG99_28325 [Myxococcaceae bacterium]|jgi:hypothetical protein